MAALTRAELDAICDIVTEHVVVPEWNGRDVIMRSLTADERDAYEVLTYETRGKDVKVNMRGMRSRLVSFCLVDESGERLYSEADIAALGKRNGAIVDRLWVVARRLSALDQKDIDELAGNSAPGRPDEPSSPSPSASA